MRTTIVLVLLVIAAFLVGYALGVHVESQRNPINKIENLLK